MLCFKVAKCMHPQGASASGVSGPMHNAAAPEDMPSTPQAFTPTKKAASLARASELKQMLLASGVTPTMPSRDQLVINLECIDATMDGTSPQVSPFTQQAGEAADADTEVQPFASASNASGHNTPLQQSSLTRSSAIRGFIRVQSLSARSRQAAPDEQCTPPPPSSSVQVPFTATPASSMPRMPTLPGTLEVDEDLLAHQEQDSQDTASETVNSPSSTATGNSHNSRSLHWTPSRRVLAQLVVREEHLSKTDKALQNLSHDRRLAERLERLGLEMVIMAGDGNCQFRTLANELFGSQDFHSHVRNTVIQYIQSHKDSFECFLGEDFDKYIASMARHGTWGDELTLRAACDAYGVTVHVVTSDPQNWFITYEPESCLTDTVELFCTYLAPIHYNAIRRKPSLRQMSQQLGSSLKRFGLTRSGHLSLSRGASSDPASPVSSSSQGL